MSVFICKFHGKVGMDLVCPHIRQAMNSNNNLPNIIKGVCHIGDPNESYSFKLTLFYCSKCVEEYDFPDIDVELTEEQFHKMEKNGFKPVCHLCFSSFYSESKKTQAR